MDNPESHEETGALPDDLGEDLEAKKEAPKK